jgi:PAS domain S-box-containing protein
MTGWNRAKAAGSPLNDIFTIISEATHEPLPNPLTLGFRSTLAGTLDPCSALLNCRGKKIPIEYNAAPMFDPDGSLTGAVVVFHDVTAQRKAETVLRQSEERRRLAAQAAMVGTYSFDFASGEAYLSDEFRHLLGIASTDPFIIDQDWIMGLAMEDRAVFQSALASAQDPGVAGQIDFEFRVHQPDGSIRWLNIKSTTEFATEGGTSRPLRAFGAAVDITERKARERELQSLNRTLRAISSSTQALMRSQSAQEDDYLAEICRIITEDCGHAMVWVGFAEADEAKSIRPVASAGSGTDYLEKLQLTWADTERGRGPGGTVVRTGHPAMCQDMMSDPAFAPWRADALARGYRSSLVLPLKDGVSTFGTLTIYSRETDAFPERELLLLQELASDLAYGITTNRLRDDHARAEEALKEAGRRKDEFLATLAHELRNPLAPIRTGAHILKLRGSDDPEIKAVYDLIGRQAGQMARLVDDLLDISRLERGKIELRRERVDFCSMAAHAVQVCRNLIEERRHRVQLDLPEQALEVDGDPVRVEQMICNLLTNACKHTPAGGEIRILAQRMGGSAVLRVQDNGIGMTPEVMEHIFDMFYQAAPAMGREERGLGLGLTLVTSLAALHGGKVTAASPGLGKGSEFTLFLPAFEPAERPAQTEEPRQDARPGPGEKANHILVIDDNPGVVTTVKMLLDAFGYRVSVAATGAAGLRKAIDLRPDLALVDLGLPDLSGLEVAARIRAELGSGIHLIALTGFSRESDIVAALAAGFDQHLVKSSDPRELLNAVKAILA